MSKATLSRSRTKDSSSATSTTIPGQNLTLATNNDLLQLPSAT